MEGNDEQCIKRQIKLTTKALEDKLDKQMKLRKRVLAHLVSKAEEIENLMINDSNALLVEKDHLSDYSKYLNEFIEVNNAVSELLSDDERKADQQYWSEPSLTKYENFLTKLELWIIEARRHAKAISEQESIMKDGAMTRQSESAVEDVNPDDSASAVLEKQSSVTTQCSKHSKSSRVSSRVSSLRKTEEANRAALLARAAALKKKQALQLEEAQMEAQLKAKKIELMTQMEELDIETAIAESTAKIQVLEEYDGSESMDSNSTNFNENMHAAAAMVIQPPDVKPTLTSCLKTAQDYSAPHSQTRHTTNMRIKDENNNGNHISTISNGRQVEPGEMILKQKDITEMLVTQQRLANLPQRKVPVFSGDPLEFLPFLRAFEHVIHSRTDNNEDRLYYLEQFTSGEPRELVRSCQNISAQRGYDEARKLLTYYYGNEQKIAAAYVDKAIKWPPIKAEDAKSLHSFSIFLTGCNNVMMDIEYLEEMNSPSSLRIVACKLPFKLRERWRVVAFEIQESEGRRAKFSDLVAYVNRQAKIASDPLFGDVKEFSEGKEKNKPITRFAVGTGLKRTTGCAISVTPDDEDASGSRKNKQTSNAFQEPCMYCNKGHTLSACNKIRGLPNKERVEFLKIKGLCFGCLTQGHVGRDCKRRATCEICNKKHPSLLHNKRDENDDQANIKSEKGQTSASRGSAPQEDVSATNEVAAVTGAGGNDSILSIVPVRIKSKKGNMTVETYAFMDSGSSATFCSERLMRQLGVPGKKTQVLLRTMGQEKPVSCFMLSDLEVCGLTENKYISLPEVYTHTDIPVTRDNIPAEKDLERWPYLLKEVRLPQIDADVEILIGSNAHSAMEPWEIIHSQNDGPYAVKTTLGWVVNGPLRKTSNYHESRQAMSRHCSQRAAVNRVSVESVDRMLLQQYSHDFPEQVCEEKSEMSREDVQFMKSVAETITKINGHYSIGMPLKNKNVMMPNNKCVAEQRATNLKRKLAKNPSFHNDYKTFMSDLLSKGYAVEVPENERSRNNGRVWYIPHHGVTHPQKGKLRVVFDCAASFQGKSLNEELLQGPDLTNGLVGVLTRFRHECVALISDIEAMYHQVRVPDEDSDLLRFLWWPQGDLSQPLREYKMVVHLFGAKSSPSCANYALRQTAEDGKDSSSPEAVITVLEHFYVDDCLVSTSDEKKATVLTKDLTALCKSGGFHLTKWSSNSRKVLSSLPEQERAKEIKNLDLDKDDLPMERALGVDWCIESDSFRFRIHVKSMPVTRRGILSVVSSIYDPLGFLSPFILPAKIIVQSLCRLKLTWDEEIPEDMASRWLAWLSDLSKFASFSVRRCIKPEGFGPVTSAQLHHFSDASERGYGVVTYLRIKNSHGQVHCSFLLGKARVTPLKPFTVPRLELTAATIAVKMDKLMKRELRMDLKESVLWTDSTTVLRYIDNDGARFKTFVANRVSAIREHTKPTQWRYVNTASNPADCASRGMKAEHFMKCPSWIEGPDFLTKNESHWPVLAEFSREIAEDDAEVKHVASASIIKDGDLSTDPLFKLTHHYSDWHSLRKAVAWMLRLKELLRGLCEKRKAFESQVQSVVNPDAKVKDNMQKWRSTLKGTYLTVKDVRQAETAIIRFSQGPTFHEELCALQKGEKVKRSSSIMKLDPFLQDGVIRVGGRLHRAALPEHTKHPAILAKDHHITTMIIRNAHEEIGHGGRNHTLARLRQRVWICKGNTAVRSVLSKCVKCRRRQSAVSEQKMANLPPDRLQPDHPPFTNVGVDYFGPFEAKRGRVRVKRYGVLFTCLTVRAVHIEVAHSLDTDSCINAVRRFIARRGQVEVMRSDNGTNLVAAEHEIRLAMKGWNQSQISEALLQRGVTWIFNPPAGSHHGGIWERQIRTVRKVLTNLLKLQLLDDECLQTLLCEVEAVINSRPLTKLSDDVDDLEPLTPNQLLLLKGKPALPPGMFQKEDLYCKRRWRQVQYISDIFWKRWSREYLPLLQERQKWLEKKRNVKEGDIVLIVDERAPRGSWLMGKVEKTLPDALGFVRRVLVKTKTNTLERPIDKLCLLLEMEEAHGQ